MSARGRSWGSDSLPLRTVLAGAICGILGQSGEGGFTAVSRTDARKVFFNAPSQNYYETRDPLNFGGNGSMFTVMAEELARSNISVRLINGSMGGASMLGQMCGVARAWTANYRYAAERGSLGNGDPGYRGDHIISSGKWFKAISGARNLAFINDGGGISWNGGTLYTSSAYLEEAGGASAGMRSGATIPAGFASAVVGGTVVDNTITWQCVADVGSYGTTLDNGLRVIRPWEPGFDPYYAMDRLSRAMLAINAALGPRYVIIQNGQSDPNIMSSWYQVALRNIGWYFMRAGIIPVFGLTVPSPLFSYQSNESVIFGGSGLLTEPQDTDNVAGGQYNIMASFLQTTAASGVNPPYAIPSYGLPGIPGTPATVARPKLWYHGVSLYRLEGGQYPAGTPNLQTDNLHPVQALAERAGKAWADRMRKIILDTAT